MKFKLTILLTILILMAGCATCPKPCCPPENAIIIVDVGIPVMIEKGFFDNKDNWMTQEEYDEILEKYLNLKGEKI